MRATAVGGGIPGLMASNAATEPAGRAQPFEAHHRHGGRARSSSGPFVTDLGPHALYGDGALWASPAERQPLTPAARPPLTSRTFEQVSACGQNERSCGDEHDRSVPLPAAVDTMTTERVPSQ
jgi:hypothetical protein